MAAASALCCASLFFLVLTGLFSQTNCQNKVQYERQANVYLANSTIRTERAQNEFQCGAFCDKESLCSSVNYKSCGKGQGTCELNNKSLGNSKEQDRLLKAGFVYLGLIKPTVCPGTTISVSRADSTGQVIHHCADQLGATCQCYKDNGGTGNGIYDMVLNGTAVQVYCDQTTDNGGWLVIQRNNGGGDFDKDWDEYKDGFGDLDGNFWWGNEKTHIISFWANMKLRIDMVKAGTDRVYGTHTGFKLSDETDSYRLTLDTGGYQGSIDDALFCPYFNKYQSVFRPFSARDRDTDDCPCNCAHTHQSGWWYRWCTQANLNKPRIKWKSYDITQAEMKIRPFSAG